MRICNVFKFKASSADFLKRDYLSQNVSDKFLWLAVKTENLHIRQCHIFAS